MEVVRSNMLDMVKELIYATDDRAVWETKDTTDVDLSLQDNDGKSVIHHCVQNRKVKTKSNLVTGYFFNCLLSVVTREPCCEVNVLHLSYPMFVETIVFLVWRCHHVLRVGGQKQTISIDIFSCFRHKSSYLYIWHGNQYISHYWLVLIISVNFSS